jgi:aryl-alcohol dehydrogenase-like predicted oxidoreductase
MAHQDGLHGDRRSFLQAGALAASAASVTPFAGRTAAQDAAAQELPAPAASASAVPVLPKRPLGKTGVEMTLLDIGTGRGRGINRLLRYAYSRGIRAFDTSATYQSEPDFKAWFEAEPAVRKEIFVVSKDTPKDPAQVQPMIEKRCEAMGTDYLDLFFIHSFGDTGVDAALNLLKNPALKQAVEAAKKSGKLKLFGISTHHRERARILETAAEVGFIDAIMVSYSPWLEADSPINKALDLCHERGIGLISMKQVAGRLYAGEPMKAILDDVAQRVPTLAERQLTPFQGLLQAIWSDERITAACVAMQNTDQIRENADAAARYKPWKTSQIQQLRDAVLAHNPTMCADCDGRCARAAGTAAALGDLTRFLTYHKHHGDRARARQLYAALPPEARDWSGANLNAARAACPNHLDFGSLLPEVDEHLA